MSDDREDRGDDLSPIPWSPEAEHGVLGALMLDNAAWDRVGDRLRPGDFFAQRHQIIFEAIGSLLTANKAADVITVGDRLKTLGEVERCGGYAYLNDMCASIISAAHIGQHAGIVREKAAQRSLLIAADEAATIARDGGSVADKLDRIATRFGRLERTQIRKEPRLLSSIVVERVDRVSELHDGTAEAGWPTGIPWLDHSLNGGLQPGRVYGLAARPAVGKSSFAQSIGLAMAGRGLTTLMLTQEMPDGELGDRAISNLGRVDYGSIQTGKLSDEGWGRFSEGVERAGQLPFWIDDQPALTIGDIRAKARMVKGLKVLIVDYLQLCASNSRKENRNSEIEEITRGLKALSKDMGVAIIVLSQLNRDVEKRSSKRPNLGDLRDSGAIEQDLDVVLFLWPVREFKSEGRKIVGLGIDKNRQGRCGEVGLDFYGAIQRWGESSCSIEPPSRTESKGFE